MANIISGLNEVTMSSYLQARKYETLYWKTLFPIKNVNSLDGKTLIGSVGSRMLAHIVSYDSKAPESSRQTMTKKYFDIPKIIDSRVKTESEILEEQLTKALRGNDAVLKNYFNDMDFVNDSCNGRIEWLALQAINKTKIQLTTSNNPKGIVNEEVVDFGMPKANKKTVAVIWSTANLAAMTPIADFKNVVKAARSNTNPVKLTKVLINQDDLDLIVGSAEFLNAAKSVITGYAAIVGLVTNDMASQVIKQFTGLEVVVIDTIVGTSNPFEAGHVAFIPQDQLGEMYSGPIAAEIEKPDGVMQSKVDPVLVQVQKTFNPVAITTTGECNVFPSWPTVDMCYNLYTLHASVWS